MPKNDRLPTLSNPLAVSPTEGETLEEILKKILSGDSVGNPKKIETKIRFEWVKNPKGELRGVIWKERNRGRATVKYIGKGRTLKERHPEYDRYAEIYEQENEGTREKSRSVD
jgi:hypothetical protein